MNKIFSIILLCSPILLAGQVADSVAMKTLDSLIQVTDGLTEKGEFNKALSINTAAETLALEKFEMQSVAYGNCCKNRSWILFRKGDYEGAVKWSLDAKSIWEKVFGKEHPNYVSSLNNLGILYRTMGNYDKAESLCLEVIAIRGKILGKEDPKYAASLENLAIVYWTTSNYEKAEPLYLEALAIRGKALGKDNAEYAKTLNNLAILYGNMGNYEKAEPFLLETLAIREKVLGKQHREYAGILNNLAVHYKHLGNYEKAESLYLEAISILENLRLSEHSDYGMYLHNLALNYQDMSNYEKAEQFFIQAKGIREKTLGKEHPYCVKNFNSLGLLYFEMGKYEKAEQYLLEAKSIWEQLSKTEDRNYAECLANLGNLYLKTGEYKKTEQFYKEAKSIVGKVVGKEHPDYTEICDGLAFVYWYMQQPDSFLAYRLEANENQKNLIESASRYLSEHELAIYTSQFETALSKDFSFAQTQPGMSSTCYDNTLFRKGFLLNAVSQVRKLALSDPATTEQYNQLKAYNRRLAAEYAKPIAERKNVEEHEEKANTLEKGLTRSVAGLGEALRQVAWQEVQQKLQPGEAAVEFVHYQFSNPKPTDSTMYAALVLVPGAKEPAFLPLFEEKQLDALLQTQGKSKPDFVDGLYTVGEAKNSLYSLLWRPLEQVLSKSQTVYFSPSGLLHRLNPGAIAMSPLLRGEAPGETLAERYRLIELGSTRQLVVPTSTKSTGNDAMLYGGIAYEMDSTAISSSILSLGSDPLATRRGLDFANADSTLRGGKWSYLRWTDVEVSATQDILADAGLTPKVRKGYEGTEESFKEIGTSSPSPRVLHLATHGFFFPDPKMVNGGRQTVDRGETVFKMSEHPMIRSGLVLAGGNYAWQTGKPFRSDREDGILTAYEISQMNLSNTELVVLSACETGLGDIQGNEGVYGLQRAFKIAGANYLIMSLWQVPDFQTQELMTSFYSLWLEDKMTIPDAFRAAQKEMKVKYKSPFLWAGFVLVE